MMGARSPDVKTEQYFCDESEAATCKLKLLQTLPPNSDLLQGQLGTIGGV